MPGRKRKLTKENKKVKKSKRDILTNSAEKKPSRVITTRSYKCSQHVEDNLTPVIDQTYVRSIERNILLIGKHENQVSEGGEVDLHQHLINCTKNPGHKEFIPIETFSRKHLPKYFRHKVLYDLIKTAADLTVRISIKMTSPKRPEFWPNTMNQYFLSDMRGSETFRTGTGKVSFMFRVTSSLCPCVKCQDSDKPSNVWWRIGVYTAAHVVFDDIEASHTTFRLFYDRNDSPLIVLKDQVRVENADVEKDMALLSCVTCDKSIGDKLEKIFNSFEGIWNNVHDKGKSYRHLHRLTFIVSHPHGCTKQVSLGQWKEKYQVGEETSNCQFTYTTSTCPGSSGAIVMCVGYNGWFNSHVHSGSLESGRNYSGVSWIAV